MVSSFKRTINQNYYNWIFLAEEDNQFRSVARLWAEHPQVSAFGVEIGDCGCLEGFLQDNPLLTSKGRQIYSLFLGMLYQFVARETPNGLIEMLEEPKLGNPLPCHLNGRRISQDIANSIRERNSLLVPFEHDVANGRRLSIVEIGAGYGRLGDVLLRSAPCTYTVVDVPPALYVSQWYLSQLFADRKVFHFRPWSNYPEIEEELRAAVIAVLTPDQFVKLPSRLFDAAVAISNLAEMTLSQVKMYLQQMDDKTRDVIYLKQWMKHANPLDAVEFVKADFDMGSGWTPTLDRVDPVQDQFFEAVWRRIAVEAVSAGLADPGP